MALTDKLKAIADAIRKNSTITDKMSLDEMADGISVVKSEAYDNGYSDGTKIAEEKPYIDTSKMKNLVYLCSYDKMEYDEIAKIDTTNQDNFGSMFLSSTQLDRIPPINTSKGIGFSQMFYNCRSLTTIPQLDVSNGNNFYSMFEDCVALREIPQLDTKYGSKFYSMFRNCSMLHTISLLDLSNATDVDLMFCRCDNLKNIVFKGRIVAAYLDMHYSPLSKESIISVINALYGGNYGSSTHTLVLSKSAVNKAFGINVDDETTYPEGSEYYELRHSKDNWTISYL